MLFIGELLSGVSFMNAEKKTGARLFLVFCLLLLAVQNLHADTIRPAFEQAEKLFSEERYPPALKYYEQAIAQDPGFILAYQGLVKTYQALGDIQGALVYMETLFMENPDSAEVFYGLGYAQFAAKAYHRAKTSFEKAIELNPGLAAAYNNIAAIYHFVDQDFDNARRYYEKAIDISRQQEDRRVLEIAEKNLSNLPRRETIEPVTEVLSLDAFVNRFIALVEENNEQGIKALVAGQKAHCEKAFDWFIRQALVAYHAGNMETESTMTLLAALAEKYYTAAFEDTRLLSRLAHYRSLDGQEKQLTANAEVLVQNALQKQGENSLPEALGLLKQALHIFEQTGSSRKQAQTYLLVGNIHRQAEDLSSAHGSYQNALTLFIQQGDEPSQARTLYLLGTTCYRLGNSDEAVEFLNRAGRLYSRLGDETTLQQIKRDIETIEKNR